MRVQEIENSNYKIPDEELLSSVKEYIRDNYMATLNIKQMAIHFATSVYRIQNIFLKFENMSIHAFIKKYRLEQASKLLSETGLPVGEIARKVGYESHSKFARAFCQYSGFSPLKYRHNLR